MTFWMKCVYFVTLLLYLGSLVDGDREIIDDYELADEICKRSGPLRSSLQPPYVCICENGYVRHDGICVRKLYPQQKATEGRGYEELDDEIEQIRNAIRQRHEQDARDFNVVPNVNVPELKLYVKDDPTTAGPVQHVEPLPPQAMQQDKMEKRESEEDSVVINRLLFTAVVAACSIAGLIGLVVAGVCWYRLQRSVKATAETEYASYGVTGPTREKVGSPGDRKLAQSAQMYHYQHQKQQMLAMEKANGELGGNGSDVDSEEENEEGDYTVYECPGLAPHGEMEVKNPLFSEDTPAVTPNNGPNNNVAKEDGRSSPPQEY